MGTNDDEIEIKNGGKVENLKSSDDRSMTKKEIDEKFGDRATDRDGLAETAKAILDGCELIARSMVEAQRREDAHPGQIVEASKQQIADKDPESLFNIDNGGQSDDD